MNVSIKNKLQNILRQAEKQHYDNLFATHKDNLNKTWNTIMLIINKHKNVAKASTFVINNIQVTDPKEIADNFNNFFVNIGPNLANKIPTQNKNPISYLNKSVTNSLFLNPVTSDELVKLISSLKSANAQGWDGILINIAYSNCINVLLNVISLSFSKGIFAKEMKIAKVIPLYKNDNNMLVNNYRPIAILPVFPKLLERLMYNRLISFIHQHKLLNKFQFGFRSQHSTNIALIYLVDKIAKAIDEKEIVLDVFLDFSKAFDTI